MRFLASALILLLAEASSFALAASIPTSGIPHDSPSGDVIEGSYLVTVKKCTKEKHFKGLADIVGSSVASILDGKNGPSAAMDEDGEKVRAQFDNIGDDDTFMYTATLNEETVDKLKQSEDVTVEPNYKVHASATVIQYGAPWGLSRLSNTDRLLLNDRTRYSYNDHSTANVKVYVIDSGINIDHVEFQGRAINAANFVSGSPPTDQFGHGTHVAATIGGATFGVAKAARIYNVKVLGADGSGSTAAVIAGINYVTEQAKARPTDRIVINMSLGGPKSTAQEAALRSAIAAGINVVVAAGNSAVDACTVSPGSSSVDGVIVVGATNSVDRFAGFSNYGTCVTVLAPGVDILSAWNKGPRSVRSIQGTSMASPHVAGLVAYWYARDATLKPAKMRARVIHYARVGKIAALVGGTPNRMAWNGF